MAGRKPRTDVKPDTGTDTLETLLNGNETQSNGGELGSEEIDGGKFAAPDELISGDEYERDDNGTVRTNRDGSPRKKRGRKAGGNSRGSGGASGGSAKKSSARNNQAIDGLSSTLLLVHSTLATFTKVEEFEIDQQESDMLAGSIANVMEQFDIQPDPKIAAIVGLVGTAGLIYGPRIALYKMRNMKPVKEKVFNPVPEKAEADTNFDPTKMNFGIDASSRPMN